MSNHKLQIKLSNYLEEKINESITKYNTDNNETVPTIANVSTDLKNAINGFNDYPAMVTVNLSRDCSDTYSTSYAMIVLIMIVSSDYDTANFYGEVYTDVLEEVIRKDYKLGGICLDVNNLIIKTNQLSDGFIIDSNFNISIDKGGFLYE